MSIHPAIAPLVSYLDGLSEKTLENLEKGMRDLSIDLDWFTSLAPNPLPATTYHRQVLHHGKGYEVVLATWPKGNGTLIHDHGDSNSSGMVRVICGSIYNRKYLKSDSGALQVDASSVAVVGDLAPVTQGLVHEMGYQSGELFAMSLHVYTPEIVNVSYWDPKTLQPVTSKPL